MDEGQTVSEIVLLAGQAITNVVTWARELVGTPALVEGDTPQTSSKGIPVSGDKVLDGWPHTGAALEGGTLLRWAVAEDEGPESVTDKVAA